MIIISRHRHRHNFIHLDQQVYIRIHNRNICNGNKSGLSNTKAFDVTGSGR